MSATATAAKGNFERPRAADNDDQRRKEAREQLDAEGDARARRIKLRKEREARQAAAAKVRRRNRAFKLTGVWAAVIVAGFFAAVWFSPEFASWVHAL